MANTQTGQVVKSVNAKTLTVRVITYKNHPLYKKRYVYSKKYLVHDPEGLARLEDRVVIRQSKPVSRRKRWVLEKVLGRGGHEEAVKGDLRAIEEAALPPEPEEKAKKPAAKPKAATAAATEAKAKPAAKAAGKPAKPAAKKPAAKGEKQ